MDQRQEPVTFDPSVPGWYTEKPGGRKLACRWHLKVSARADRHHSHDGLYRGGRHLDLSEMIEPAAAM